MKVYQESNLKVYHREDNIEVEYNHEGSAYFWFNDCKYYLNEFMRFIPGQALVIGDVIFHAHMGLTNTSSMVIRLNESADAIEAAIIG